MLMAYDDYGPGPVVVLLHGFPLNRKVWSAQETSVGSIYRVDRVDDPRLDIGCGWPLHRRQDGVRVVHEHCIGVGATHVDANTNGHGASSSRIGSMS